MVTESTTFPSPSLIFVFMYNCILLVFLNNQCSDLMHVCQVFYAKWLVYSIVQMGRGTSPLGAGDKSSEFFSETVLTQYFIDKI